MKKVKGKKDWMATEGLSNPFQRVGETKAEAGGPTGSTQKPKVRRRKGVFVNSA